MKRRYRGFRRPPAAVRRPGAGGGGEADAVAIGPGSAEPTDGRARPILLERLELPVVLDADAPGSSSRSRARRRSSHRTAASLRGSCASTRAVDAHRLDAARRAASRFGAVVLLKGADTIVAAPREGVLVASYGTPALATAGSGDVLTGIVAAFLAKGVEPRLAAATAAVAHGVAAELLDPQPGAVASDLLPALQRALAGHGLQRAPLQ